MSTSSILEEAYADPVLFCKYFLAHLFPGKIPWIHRGLMAILTRQTEFLLHYGELDKIISNFVEVKNDEITPIFRMVDGKLTMHIRKNTAIGLPRGFSKTTIAGVAMPLWDVCYREVPFFLYCSESGSHSTRQIGNVKYELENNAKIKAVFGELRPERSSDLKWAEDSFETRTGAAFTARGRGGQVRGLLHKGNRPKRVIVDDLEDLESVETEGQRDKVRNWFYGDLLPVLPRMDKEAGIVVLGTVLHRDALLVRLALDPKWTYIRFGVIDRQGAPIWPENMSLSDLEQEKLSYASQGLLFRFYLEYFNEVRNLNEQTFRPDYVHYGLAPVCPHVAIYVDPAISEDRRADQAVVVAVGMESNGKIWVLDGWAKRGAEPREIVDQFFEFSKRYSGTQHGVESISYQRALVHLLKEEMFRKNHYFEVTAVTHGRVKKEERIRGVLAPRYAAGYIHHARPFAELESQLYDFPGAVHDDWPDAVAGAVALLDPYAAAAAGDRDLGEDEFLPLEEELGEWRAH